MEFIKLKTLTFSFVLLTSICFAQVDGGQSRGVSFVGTISKPYDLSAIACISSNNCLVGSDEGSSVYVVKRSGQNYEVIQKITLTFTTEEIDIEAIAAWGDSYYIIGSHGMSRKKCKA